MTSEHTVCIKVDPLRVSSYEIFPYPPKLKSNINKNITAFLNSLSFNHFFLAGNSVANMIENVPIIGDLDFWVSDSTKYVDVLKEFKTKNPTSYNIYPSMIEMIFPNLPIINLILSNKSPQETAQEFDFDYCRCFYTNQMGPIASLTCLTSIFTKTISHPAPPEYIRYNRILKALRYGYSFNYEFWNIFSRFLKKQLICNICRITNSSHCNHHSVMTTITPIKLNDLQLMKFEQCTFGIKITDITNVNNTISELSRIFNHYYGIQMAHLKLPKLFSLFPNQFYLVKEYATKIVMLNPINHGDYWGWRINKRRVYHIINTLFSINPSGFLL